MTKPFPDREQDLPDQDPEDIELEEDFVHDNPTDDARPAIPPEDPEIQKSE